MNPTNSSSKPSRAERRQALQERMLKNRNQLGRTESSQPQWPNIL